jgi:hypothetical protein
MDITQARTEINNRLNILNSKKAPNINKQDLRKGLNNLTHRKEIGSYKKNIESQKKGYLNLLHDLDTNNSFSAMSGESGEEEINLGMFKEPSMKRVRNQGRGYFY